MAGKIGNRQWIDGKIHIVVNLGKERRKLLIDIDVTNKRYCEEKLRAERMNLNHQARCEVFGSVVRPDQKMGDVHQLVAQASDTLPHSLSV